MKKYLFSLGVILASIFQASASDANPYVGTANERS